MASSLLIAAVGVVVVVFFSLSLCQRQPPHILFIVADDLGWNDVGWRDPHFHTPTLSHYASQGILLNNSYVQPMCSPSRAAFMSGMYPYRLGLQHGAIWMTSKSGLPTGLTTLPQALKDVGYVTHMVGKWHLGYCSWDYTPTYRGFDSFMGFYGGRQDYYTHCYNVTERRPNTTGFGIDFRNNTDPIIPDNMTYSEFVYTQRAMQIIAQHDMTKPLFLYLPMQSVHEPLQVPKVYEDTFFSEITNKTRKTKCGMVAIMDEAVKNITGLMDTRGFFDNMLMIFTSDNGAPVWDGGSNWPLRGAKGTLWEGGTRAASFVYSKSLFRSPGTVHEGLFHAVDWYPTLLNMAGGMPLSPIDGVNQWECLAGDDPSPRSEFVYNIDDLKHFHAAIRVGDWKLIQGSVGRWNDWYPVEEDTPASQYAPVHTPPSLSKRFLLTDDFQLFNIKEDPTEHHDVKDQNPDVLARMKARLSELRGGMVPAQDNTHTPASNPDNFGGFWSPGWC